jgi:hypothetical protein
MNVLLAEFLFVASFMTLVGLAYFYKIGFLALFHVGQVPSAINFDPVSD